MENTPKHNARQGFFSGVKMALPIVTGYVPVSFAFGVLAVNVGMTPLDALLMGLLYFAGSGQLMTVAMLAATDLERQLYATLASKGRMQDSVLQLYKKEAGLQT